MVVLMAEWAFAAAQMVEHRVAHRVQTPSLGVTAGHNGGLGPTKVLLETSEDAVGRGGFVMEKFGYLRVEEGLREERVEGGGLRRRVHRYIRKSLLFV